MMQAMQCLRTCLVAGGGRFIGSLNRISRRRMVFMTDMIDYSGAGREVYGGGYAQ